MHSIALEALLDLIEYGEELVLFASRRDTEGEEIERMRYLPSNGFSNCLEKV